MARRRSRWGVGPLRVFAFLGILAAGPSLAASDLESALEALASAADSEQALSPEFRDALGGLIDALRAEADTERAAQATPAAAPASVAAAAPRASLMERIQLFGDVRLRYEHDRNRPGSDDRNRARLRLRVGAEVSLHPELVAGFRVRTGDPDDPNSPHQTFDSMFDSYAFDLDRAYVRWRPSWLAGATVTAGKFGSPFLSNPVYGELVWDADVNPEGVALTLAREVGDGHSLRLALGEYVLQEQGGADEATLFAAQAAGSARLAEGWKGSAALAWYRYANLNPDGSTFTVRDNAGNLVSGGEYASEFSVWNPHASLSYSGFELPVTLAGEYFYNSRSSTDDDSGFAVGVSVGKVQRSRDWRAWYQYQRVEREAVFTAFAQDDFPLTSNWSGHLAGVDLGVAEAISLRAWTLISREIETGPGVFDDDRVRIRLDLNAKF